MSAMAQAARLKLSVVATAALLASGAAFAQGSKPAPVPPAAASAAPSGSAAPKPPSVTGGYSWSDKPRKGAHHVRHVWHRRIHFDPNAPIATFPGFRMLPGGKSEVWVNLSKSVNVQVRRAPGRVVYVLNGAQVTIRNNMHPLVTTYFDTPLARARLAPEKGAAELVLELREKVEPSYRVAAGPGGTSVLEVTLPAPKRNLVPADRIEPSMRLHVRSGTARLTRSRTLGPVRRVGPHVGPNP
jgi:hypothetical protein